MPDREKYGARAIQKLVLSVTSITSGAADSELAHLTPMSQTRYRVVSSCPKTYNNMGLAAEERCQPEKCAQRKE
jgi:hypothetical protein